MNSESETPTAAQALADRLERRFEGVLLSCVVWEREVTIEIAREHLLEVGRALRDDPDFQFRQLVDLCGVDYSEYGESEWVTNLSTATGFSRGVEEDEVIERTWEKPRFAVVSHLLSHSHNRRLRLRTFTDGEPPVVDSVVGLWASASWFEREAFDLYGILFEGHPDLRRILTDYGFIGHPFRKDFPLIGHVEMRYDPERQRVVYQPVTIEPRVLVPRVIRSNHYRPERSQSDSEQSENA